MSLRERSSADGVAVVIEMRERIVLSFAYRAFPMGSWPILFGILVDPR